MMQIEPWHVPVLAMTLVVLPVVAFWFLGWRRRNTVRADGGETTGTPDILRATGPKLLRTRTITLAVLTLVLLGFSVLAAVLAPPELLNLIAAAMTAVSGAVSATLTIESFRDARKEAAAAGDAGGTGDPGRKRADPARQQDRPVRLGGLRNEIRADDSAFDRSDPTIRQMFHGAEPPDDADR